MTNVLIVEDDPMARKLVEIFVSSDSKYRLVRSLNNASKAMVCCEGELVELVLMAVCASTNTGGLAAAAQIKKRLPHIKIIMMTSQPDRSFIECAKQAGVDSFWYKKASAEEMLKIMDQTMAGQRVYPTKAPVVKLGDIYSDELTNRELEVLHQLVAGQTDATIAEKLYMSLRTVKGHIQNLKSKTGFQNRTELAVRARERGIAINYSNVE